MGISYLLDTSAIRSLSGEVLQNLSEQHSALWVSPYCFWEILCHLDEHEKFERFKAELMKFKYVEVLDDPHASLYFPFMPKDSIFQKRVPDNDIIYKTLAALRDSDSLDGFYSLNIKDSKGNRRQISDCTTRVRKILKEDEKNYTTFIQNIINVFQSKQLELETEINYHHRIMGLIEGEVIKLKQKGGSDVKLREKVIASTYIHYSYIFHRALQYFREGKTNIDKNDYEDSMTCLHLKLQTPHCLVAADKGMRDALNETISLLKKLNNSQFFSTLQVKNAEDFRMTN